MRTESEGNNAEKVPFDSSSLLLLFFFFLYVHNSWVWPSSGKIRAAIMNSLAPAGAAQAPKEIGTR